MSQLRRDPLTGRWVAITSERAKRPRAFLTSSAPEENGLCPFCLHENELDAPIGLPDLSSVEGPLGPARVIPNLYPAFSGTTPLRVERHGPLFMNGNGSGSHELLIFSPEHTTEFANLPFEQLSASIDAVKARMVAHEAIPAFRTTQCIVNFGTVAGATLRHPHGQLLALPFLPEEILYELSGFSSHRGGCLLCRYIDEELQSNDRIVASNRDTAVICPYWSSNPYEMLVLGQLHEPRLSQGDPALRHLIFGEVARALQALVTLRGEFAYNLVLHSQPRDTQGPFHWHVHIVPKLTTRAGFEIGSGVPVNIVAPEDAAAQLRDCFPK